jgi:putative transposase
VFVPKYRKAVLVGEVAIRVRDLLRQIAMEHELEIVSGKVARDHVHLFVSYRPNQQVSRIMQWLKGISSRVLLQEFPELRKKFWGKHFWARGYLAVSSGTIYRRDDPGIHRRTRGRADRRRQSISNRQPLEPLGLQPRVVQFIANSFWQCIILDDLISNRDQEGSPMNRARRVSLLGLLLITTLACAATLKSVSSFDLPGPAGKRFDYLAIDYDDHYLLSAHLAAGLLYVVDLRTNR